MKRLNNKAHQYLLFLLFLLIIPSSCHSNRDRKDQDNQLHLAIEGDGRDVKNEISPKEILTLASWNIQHLGRTKTEEEIQQIAQILRNFDIVAIQEVVAKNPAGAQAVAKIADKLNRMGAKWDYIVSNPTKSPSPYISERYAFLWKTSKVEMIHRAYLDEQLEEVCYREPYIARFRKKGSKMHFYVVNFHARRYNMNPDEEIIYLLDYEARLKSDRVIIAGDFNLDEKHKVWAPFYAQGYKSALQNTPTTLKWKCKDNSYRHHAIDNLFYAKGIIFKGSGLVDFVETCEGLEEARKISDHLPVFMEFALDSTL